MAQTVKNFPAMWETWVRFLGQEDLLEKEMATHSSTLAWKILWTEEPGRLQSMGSQRVGWTRLCNFTSFQDNNISHSALFMVLLRFVLFGAPLTGKSLFSF